MLIGLCATEIFVGAVSFVFAFYGYQLMKDVNEKFGDENSQDSGNSDLKKSIYLYSAFSNYDELTNCAVALGAIAVGKFRFW